MSLILLWPVNMFHSITCIRDEGSDCNALLKENAIRFSKIIMTGTDWYSGVGSGVSLREMKVQNDLWIYLRNGDHQFQIGILFTFHIIFENTSDTSLLATALSWLSWSVHHGHSQVTCRPETCLSIVNSKQTILLLVDYSAIWLKNQNYEKIGR